MDILTGFKTGHSNNFISCYQKKPQRTSFLEVEWPLSKDHAEYVLTSSKKVENEVGNDYKANHKVDTTLLYNVVKMQIKANSTKHAQQKQTEKTLETETLRPEQKLENNFSEVEKCEIRT